MTDEAPKPPPRISLLGLLLLFANIGLTSFGGSSMAWMHRHFVERRKMVDEQGFLTGLTIAQVLPGANPVNLAIYFGMQSRGRLGAVVAALGIVLPAFCVIMFMGYLYRSFSGFEMTHAVLGGVAAAGVGATMAVGMKLARQVMRDLVPALIAIFTFIVVGVLRWPLVPVVSVLVPLSILHSYLLYKRRGDAG